MTPDVPALRAALAAYPFGPPWTIRGGLIDDGVPEGRGYKTAEVNARRALIVTAVNALPGLLDLLDAQRKVLDLVRETEAPGGHHRLRRLHEELEDAWTALERLEAPDGR